MGFNTMSVDPPWMGWLQIPGLKHVKPISHQKNINQCKICINLFGLKLDG